MNLPANILLPVFIFFFGACIGSFLNVVIWRLPRGESIVFPGSHCPKCGNLIKWYDNIPVISWLILEAKCRYCKESISARYPLIEALTGVLVTGLYACYFVWHVREGCDNIVVSWPILISHSFLVCGLLACSIIDMESWHIPLEICWVVSLAGLVAATLHTTNTWLPMISRPTGAASIGAGIGLVIAIILQKRGVIQPSFIDAEPAKETDSKTGKKPESVAYTSADGVNPRLEVLREVVFLAPAFIGAFVAWFLVSDVPFIARGWRALFEINGGKAGLYINGFTASLFGYLIGGLWIWGIRIIGTLGFGKEAMGLGDVHIMAAVGAVCGWIIPSIAFFLAPVFGIVWTLCLALKKGRTELPYGPWLSLASLITMIFHDGLIAMIDVYCRHTGITL